MESSLIELKTCTYLKGIVGSCKATQKGILDMEVKKGDIITLKTTELYVPRIQCHLFIPHIYFKEYNDH